MQPIDPAEVVVSRCVAVGDTKDYLADDPTAPALMKKAELVPTSRR